MSKKIVSMLLALAIVLTLGAPVLAAEDSPVRLTRVEIYSDGLLYQLVELSYFEDGHLQEQSAETYYYDGSGPAAQSSRVVTTYNTDGRAEKDESAYMLNGEVTASESVAYTYDEDGQLIESVDEFAQEGYSSSSVNTYDYEYDDQGRLAVTTQYSDGEAIQAKEYTYDEKGRVATINNRMVSYGWAYLNEYTYDEEDRVVTNRVTYDNGAPGTYWEYAYESDTYFQLRYSMQYNEDAETVYKPVGGAFYAEIPSREDFPGLSFSLRNTPQLIYDEAGYLVMADAGEGNYISFFYEPAV